MTSGEGGMGATMSLCAGAGVGVARVAGCSVGAAGTLAPFFIDVAERRERFGGDGDGVANCFSVVADAFAAEWGGQALDA